MVSDTAKTLERELERLKRTTHHGQDLRVKWLPVDKQVSGEIKNNIIFIYDFDEPVALDTLCHEFIEYIVIKSIEPYRQLANKLMEMFNENAYAIKEETVEGITNLVSGIRMKNRPDEIS